MLLGILIQTFLAALSSLFFLPAISLSVAANLQIVIGQQGEGNTLLQNLVSKFELAMSSSQ